MARFSRQAHVAERRARVLQLRIEHRTYADIARELGITPKLAQLDFTRALRDFTRQQAERAPAARDLELAKLDALEAAAWRVLQARHITVQHGRIVRDEDGQVVEDDAPVLQAVDRLVRIAQRRATLTGMDAPTRIEVDDARRAEIERIAAELAAAGVGDLEPGRAGTAAGQPETGEGGPHPA